MIITDQYDSPAAARRRELMLCGMEARYQVQGGLLYTDVELLDCRVQQLMREGALLDLEPHELTRLAAALMRGYAEANPVASDQDVAYAAEVAERHRTARRRRRSAKLERQLAGMRQAVATMGERLRAMVGATVRDPASYTLVGPA